MRYCSFSFPQRIPSAPLELLSTILRLTDIPTHHVRVLVLLLAMTSSLAFVQTSSIPQAISPSLLHCFRPLSSSPPQPSDFFLIDRSILSLSVQCFSFPKIQKPLP